MDPRGFSAMESGESLAPDSWGGPERRKAAGDKLIVYLMLLAGRLRA
jgi:hypothetical protein